MILFFLPDSVIPYKSLCQFLISVERLNKNCRANTVPTNNKVLVLLEIILPLMQLDFIAEISSVSTWGSGVDIILDCVGASHWEKNLNCLSTDGRWIIYGLLSGGEVHGDLLARLLSKRASIHTSLLRSRDKEASSSYQQRMQLDF